jgi:hypothetical protein
MTHDCKQEEAIGKIKEFVDSTKGLKATILTISCAILLQVGGFIWMWSSLTTTVNQNTEHLWKDITPQTMTNTRNIDKILSKLEFISIVQASDKEKDGMDK